MKITNLFILFALVFATVSCNKDDDGPEPFLLTKSNIAGNYKTTLLKAHMEQTYTVNNVPIVSVTDVEGDTFQLTTVFGADGTYTNTGQYRIVTTTTTGGQTVTNSEIVLIDDEGTYVLNPTSNKITITTDDASLTFDVTTFNPSQLHLLMKSSEPVDGVPTTSTLEVHLERK